MKKISFKFPQTARLKEAKKIAETVNFHGGKAFIVGGAVRDMYLGKEVKDIDIVCTLLPQKLIEIFPNSQLVGVVFGVIIVKVNEYNFEIATAREERNYLDGRHPELIVATDDLKVDSQRRDFTINALLYDFINEEIIDYQGGLKDLDNGIIRAVGDANLRFNEDYLRMLRLIRFASRLNFKIEEKTFDALKKNAHLCGILATERVKKELDLMFNHRNASLALEYLSCSGLLKVILPEIELLRNLPQNPVYHPEGDVFEHTLLMLKKMKYPSVNLAWSIILHDVGKFKAFNQDENGNIHFYSHEVYSKEIATIILERLKFSKQSIKKIISAVANHMRFASVLQMKKVKILRLISDDNFPLELELHRLDCASSHNMLDVFNYLLDEVAHYNGVPVMPTPILTGKDLIKLGFKSGPKFKKILDFVYQQQLLEKISNLDDAIKLIKQEMKA